MNNIIALTKYIVIVVALFNLWSGNVQETIMYVLFAIYLSLEQEKYRRG